MSKKDVTSRKYLKDPRRVADLMNGFVYGGAEVLKPEDVREKSGNIFRARNNEAETDARERTVDMLHEIKQGVQVLLVAIENQTDIHYVMPVRVMDAESMIYHEQWKQIEKAHHEKKDLKGAEYLSGFAKGDRLTPVITIVVYLGKKPWDGPRSLKSIMNLGKYPKQLKALIVDHPIHILEVRNFPHLEYFKTDLQLVFGFLQQEEDKDGLAAYVKEHEEEFSELPEDTYDFICAMSHSKEVAEAKEKYKEEGESYNMCRAITEMIEDGRTEGQLKLIITQTCKKLIKKKPISSIADELEETVERITAICEVAEKHAPEYDTEVIYAELCGKI